MSEGNVTRAEILPLLGEVKVEGDWVMAWCPAHPDGQKHGMKGGRSLGLSKTGVLKCYAGCDFKDVITALRGDRPVTKPTPIAPAQKMLTATYEYRDQDGILCGIKERWEWPNPERGKNDKEFRWHKPGQKAALKMEDMPLWGADLLKDVPMAQRVWFVEGEKACEALRARNEIALTSGGGSSQKTFGQAFDILKGRNVWLWPDNDDPGRKYLRVLKTVLTPTVGSLKVIQPKDMPEAGDAYDFFAAGRQLDELDAYANRPTTMTVDAGRVTVVIPTSRFDVEFVWSGFSRNRGEFNAELTVCPQSMFGGYDPIHTRINVLSQSAVSTLRLACESAFGGGRGDYPMEPNWASVINRAIDRVRDGYEDMRASTVEELTGDPENVLPPLICGPYVMDGAGSFLFGPPGKGKSTMALLMAVSMDAGVNHLWPVQQRKVMYINLERDRSSMRRRLARVNYVLDLPENRPLLMLNARGSILSDLLDTIRSAISKYGVTGVFLDSVSRAGYGDLNDNSVANRVADALNGLGLWWVAIAHSPRGDDTHIYGSVMQDAAADIMINISAEGTGTELGIGLQITKANDQALTGEVEQFAIAYNEGGIVEVRRAHRTEFSELQMRKKLTLYEAVKDYLSRNGSATATLISDATGKRRDEVSRILNDKRDQFVLLEKRGKEAVYGLKSMEG